MSGKNPMGLGGIYCEAYADLSVRTVAKWRFWSENFAPMDKARVKATGWIGTVIDTANKDGADFVQLRFESYLGKAWFPTMDVSKV